MIAAVKSFEGVDQGKHAKDRTCLSAGMELSLTITKGIATASKSHYDAVGFEGEDYNYSFSIP
jgi:hypothetical protein